MPLSEVEVFSPEAVPSGEAPFEEGPESHRTHGHPREMAGEGRGVFGRKDAVGLTPGVAGAMSPAVFAGRPCQN